MQCLKRLALDARLAAGLARAIRSRITTSWRRSTDRVDGARDADGSPAIQVTGFEAAHGFHYTYETLDYPARRLPGPKLRLDHGRRQPRDFDRWERWQEIAAADADGGLRPARAPRLRATRRKAATALAQLPHPRGSEAETLADRDPPAWVYLRA